KCPLFDTEALIGAAAFQRVAGPPVKLVELWKGSGAGQAFRPAQPTDTFLDATTLGRAASVVRLGRHVVDAADLEARGLKRTDRRLTTRTRTLHEHVDLLDAVLLRL